MKKMHVTKAFGLTAQNAEVADAVDVTIDAIVILVDDVSAQDGMIHFKAKGKRYCATPNHVFFWSDEDEDIDPEHLEYAEGDIKIPSMA